MSPNHARDLAIKLFGLYCVVHFVEYVPAYLWNLVAGFVSPSESPAGLETAAFVMAQALPPLFFLGAGLFCLLRTNRVTGYLWNKERPSDKEDAIHAQPLGFWLTLIGVFFAIRGISGLGSTVADLLLQRRFEFTSYNTQQLVSNGIMLILAWYCVRKTERVTAMLTPAAGDSP